MVIACRLASTRTLPRTPLNELIAQLSRELGDSAVLTGDDVRIRQAGWEHPGGCAALAVVRPASTEDVSRALALCHEAGQPVCVQGGLTGLVEGGVAEPEEVVLSLERLDAIEDVDRVGRTLLAQAGVPLQRIQEAALDAGMIFPLDLGARGSCQIGGNVATNAGGNRVVRFGMTRQMVLGLEAVLADGTVLSSLNRMVKNNSGYDLKQLFIGSEGTLGVVTRVVLRLEREPRSQNTGFMALDGFEQLTDLLAHLESRLASQLSAFEVMWPEFYQLVTGEASRLQPPLPYGHRFYVLAEALGPDAERDRELFERVLEDASNHGLFADAVLGTTRKEREALWEVRDNIEQLSDLGPYFTFDVSLRIADMEGYVRTLQQAVARRWPDGHCLCFGHLADGNLHPVVAVGDKGPATRREVEALVYDPLRALGGAISAEHGIGHEKRPYLDRSRSPEEIELMRRLKRTLDPKGILNRGRVFGPVTADQPAR